MSEGCWGKILGVRPRSRPGAEVLEHLETIENQLTDIRDRLRRIERKENDTMAKDDGDPNTPPPAP